jgi:hypothetical protein
MKITDTNIEYLGQTYIYPTPNNGECPIGIIHYHGAYFAAWQDPKTLEYQTLNTPHLTSWGDLEPAQEELDTFATKKMLFRIRNLPPTTTTADSSPTLADVSDTDGGRNSITPCSPLPAPCSILPSPCSIPTGWHGVRYWTNMAGKFERAKLASQVMAGFELLALRKDHNVKHGGDRRSKPNVSDLIEQTPWPELVKQNAGISDDTARNYMAMAEACKPRLKKLAGSDRLRELLLQPPSQWTADDYTLIEATVHKITDGKTQLEFMWELGVAKKPQGSGATGGYRPALGEPVKLTLEQQLEESKRLAAEDFDYIISLFTGYWSKFSILEDWAIEGQIGILEQQIAARRAWLKQPAGKRTTDAVEKTLKP